MQTIHLVIEPDDFMPLRGESIHRREPDGVYCVTVARIIECIVQPQDGSILMTVQGTKRLIEERGKYMNDTEFIEKLSDAAHRSWCHWMEYLFSRCERLSDGSMVIPHELVKHWQRQMDTPYEQLSEKEKQSDRVEVAHILPIISAYQERKEQA